MNRPRHPRRLLPIGHRPHTNVVPFDYLKTALAYQLLPDDDGDESLSGRMGLLEHLEELRRRLIRCCIAVAIGMAIAFTLVGHVLDFVLVPVERALPAGSGIVYTNPSEGFSLYVDLALISGALLASPYVMFQVWRFIAPGLYANEKKLLVPFVVLMTLGIVGGAAFNHYVAFPSMIAFFGSFSTNTVKMTPRLEDIWSLYSRTLVAMCIGFQLPTLAFFLGKMHVITARFLWQNFGYAILGIFIAAAVLTSSTDASTQVVFALPMIGLYLLSIGIIWAVQRGRTER